MALYSLRTRMFLNIKWHQNIFMIKRHELLKCTLNYLLISPHLKIKSIYYSFWPLCSWQLNISPICRCLTLLEIASESCVNAQFKVSLKVTHPLRRTKSAKNPGRAIALVDPARRAMYPQEPPLHTEQFIVPCFLSLYLGSCSDPCLETVQPLAALCRLHQEKVSHT